MRPRALVLPLLVLLFVPALANAACNLSMTLTCTPGSPTTCRAVTTNNGPDACSGEYIAGLFVGLPTDAVTISNASNTLGLTECFSSGATPGVSQPFEFCFGAASLGPGASFTQSATIAAVNANIAEIPVIAITYVFNIETGEELGFVYAFNDVDQPTCTPIALAPAIAQSDTDYAVAWSRTADPATTYQIEESTSADFSTITSTRTSNTLSQTYRHVVTSNTTYYYRVRANACANGQPGPYSTTVAVVVQAPPPPSTARDVDAVVPFGSSTPVRIPIAVSGAAGTEFTASVDKEFLSVAPAQGTIPSSGTATVDVIANPANLPPGANTGTLQVATLSGTPLRTTPVSISLVTPVQPASRSLPPGNALIIPVVTHAIGGGGLFQSDVRVTNGSATAVTYQITFTPTRTDATRTSRATTLTVDPGQTLAMNDIARDFFGFGASDPNEVGFGALEIRPLNTSSTQTYASSRTYANTPTGTFGQYIAAVPFTRFATNATSGIPIPGGPGLTIGNRLSLQQVAQSARFRTNLGIVEGSGTPASGRIRVFNAAGQQVGSDYSFTLLPGEHQQLNQFISQTAGIPSLDDGRIEILVDSPTGAVTAYASVLDNTTTDPLAVMPVAPSTISQSRYTLPGMADLGGTNNFHSDVRIFNGGASPVNATLTYVPRTGNNPSTVGTVPVTIAPGEVKVYDNVLPTLFGATSTGGSILVTTNGPSSLVATGRTYSIGANNGTFGQFIPAVSPSEGTGAGERALQVLQLEQSQNFRSNLGLAELTGNPVSLRVSLITPGSRTTPSIPVELGPNEFRQLDRIIAGFAPGENVYNARITVEVTGGTGRVTAYGSVIDNATNDPTYVPAQY